jgi:GTPase SAR1 family protein
LAPKQSFFFIPQSVSSIFTGREVLLDELKAALEVTPSPEHTQKRFVVCGPGGSGKTQFCCKYAQNNRDK